MNIASRMTYLSVNCIFLRISYNLVRVRNNNFHRVLRLDRNIKNDSEQSINYRRFRHASFAIYFK